jgi:hypothetical protein
MQGVPTLIKKLEDFWVKRIGCYALSPSSRWFEVLLQACVQVC